MFGLKWLENKESKWHAFEGEAMQFRGDLYRTAMWLTRNQSDAEDLVQETMFQAMRSFHLFEQGTNCKAWLMRILYNHNTKRIRNMLKLRLVQDVDDALISNVPYEAAVSQTLTDEEVIAAIWRLAEHYRIVLVLADIDELSYKDISAVLELPIGTVMSRLFRARKILRIDLAEYSRSYGFAETSRATN